MPRIVLMLLVSVIPYALNAQYRQKLSQNISLNINENFETYFFAEKLAVEHIGYYVFTNKNSGYQHQPLVSHSASHFMKWKDSQVILKIAAVLEKLRPVLHDNAQILEYLWYCNSFPKTGLRYPLPEDAAVADSLKYPGAEPLVEELAALLNDFHRQAKVGEYIRSNKRYYQGAMSEAARDIAVKAIPYEEKWYGKKFPGYVFILMPGMPIPEGEDNYRAFGIQLAAPGGRMPSMVFSSSLMVPERKKLSDYRQFGFDNQQVTRFLTVHELGHSFVNPLLTGFKNEIQRDTLLFTSRLKKHLESSYIHNWENCITEHLVRLGEIRTAKMMGDTTEEQRLRKEHTVTLGFVLLPLLEKVIVQYETGRQTYPDFRSFLPVIFKTLHGLKPEDIDDLIQN